MHSGNMRVAWHADNYNPAMASIRVRLIEPIGAMQRLGYDADTYSPAVGPAGYDAVVFSKSFSSRSLGIARQLRALGKCVVFDICDNIHQAKAGLGYRQKVARFDEMLSLATHITCSTPILAAQIAAVVPDVAAKMQVIPDALDALPVVDRSSLGVFERHHLSRLERFIARHPGALHCVWFGKSYGKIAGFSHLDRAVRELDRFSRHHPVTLSIISNERWRYWQSARRWAIPTAYMPWSINSFRAALALHDVAIIPVEKNDYTVGKTINRPATAIMAGLGVVADAIDAYEELRLFVSLDDWQGGLQLYAEAAPATRAQLVSSLDAK